MSKTFTTGIGVVGAYAFITKPHKKYKSEELEYQATVTLSKADGEALIAEMEQARNEFRQDYKKKKGKVLPNGELYKIKVKGKVDEETGDFVRDASGEYELKLQKDAKKGSIKVVDTKCNDVTTKVTGIGEGSTMKVMLNINACEVGGKAIVTVSPIAVQIIDLVEYGGVSDESVKAAFGVVDGGYVFTEEETKETSFSDEVTEEDISEEDEQLGF